MTQEELFERQRKNLKSILKHMNREEILKSPYYWLTRLQIDLFRLAASASSEAYNSLELTDEEKRDLMNGDSNLTLEKFCETVLKLGYMPKIDFIPISGFYPNGEIHPDTFKSNVNY